VEVFEGWIGLIGQQEGTAEVHGRLRVGVLEVNIAGGLVHGEGQSP
jgi:hypothetical protein